MKFFSKVKDLQDRYPVSLRRLGLSPLGILMLVIVGCIPLFTTNQFTIRLFITACMTATLAMGFDFTNGYIGICNFGYAAFWGVGAYTSAILVKSAGLPLPLGLLAAFLVTAVMGVLIGCLTIRLGGIFASCMCWFVSLALLALARNLVDLTGGASGYSATFMFPARAGYTPYFYVIFAVMVAVYIGLTYIINSKTGLAFRAIALDNTAAGSCGINHITYKIFNFALSCAIAGLVGALYIHFVGIMTPKSMSNDRTVEIMAICFIGGRGTIWGSVLSAVALTPLLEATKDLLEWRQVLYGLLMILIMIFYPRGFAGLLLNLKERLERAVEKYNSRKAGKAPQEIGKAETTTATLATATIETEKTKCEEEKE